MFHASPLKIYFTWVCKIIKMSFLILLSSIWLLGCNQDKGSDVARPNSENNNFSSKPGDIKNLPLELALQKKYSQIIFVCDYQLEMFRSDKIGGISKTQLLKQFFVKDLLQDFQPKFKLNLDYEYEMVKSGISWEFEVGLTDKVKVKSNINPKEAMVELEDAVFLKGSSVTQISELDEKGRTIGSSEVFQSDKFYYDRITHEVVNSENKFTEDLRNVTKFNLNCTLDTIVKKGFESQFRVVK